eukprot:6180437-Pleurochrysis_carterae.AAC.2
MERAATCSEGAALVPTMPQPPTCMRESSLVVRRLHAEAHPRKVRLPRDVCRETVAKRSGCEVEHGLVPRLGRDWLRAQQRQRRVVHARTHEQLERRARDFVRTASEALEVQSEAPCARDRQRDVVRAVAVVGDACARIGRGCRQTVEPAHCLKLPLLVLCVRLRSLGLLHVPASAAGAAQVTERVARLNHEARLHAR